jgi:mannose-6-phosphate isomerase
MSHPRILQLEPEYREYVWGGARLRPDIIPTAEAWVVYENNRVATGQFAGRTLAGLVSELGVEILGTRVVHKTGLRFPLLIKLLDCARWLSLQVHPSDEQALALEGPDQFGKTEAWHVLEAVPDARLIGGLKPGCDPQQAADAIRNGSILELAQYLEARRGDTFFMPPGTIHALGPGLFIYEVQETSDLTYRVWDWNRPQEGGRTLHIEKSLAVMDPASSPHLTTLPEIQDGRPAVLTRCPYFTLERLEASQSSIALDTRGETFHAITMIAGSAVVEHGDERLHLAKYQTALLAAAAGEYRLVPAGPFTALKSSIDPA